VSLFIVMDNIPVSKVVYNKKTSLFSFSPRQKIDTNLVENLKASIGELGFWTPVILNAQYEGIAGNHRFLAYLEHAKETGIPEHHLTIPAIVIDCDEATAVSVALAENEVREDLLLFETLRSLMLVSRKKPQVSQKVFRTDRETLFQLNFWQQEINKTPELFQVRHPLQKLLNREWLELLSNRLANYPVLHEKFLEQLRHPTWVQARSLADFDREISQALMEYGIQFQQGETWNPQPTDKCLNNAATMESLLQHFQAVPTENPVPGNTLGLCPLLLLQPTYLKQGAEGSTQAIFILDRLDAFCVDPKVAKKTSCFSNLERECAEQTVNKLISEGVHAILPERLIEKMRADEFSWACPILNGDACTPQTCLHRGAEVPAYALVVHPNGEHTMICLHAECGTEAQTVLIDLEAESAKLEQQRQLNALNELRRATVEHTLLASEDQNIQLDAPGFMEKLESILTPHWDLTTMEHIVIGWQAATRQLIANQLGLTDLNSPEVIQKMSADYGALTTNITLENTSQLFGLLHERYCTTSEARQRWLACVIAVRAWRDETNNIERISAAQAAI